MCYTLALGPEGPFLPAQAEGLGKNATAIIGPEGAVHLPTIIEPALQAEKCGLTDFPGLRPGLSESAFQAEGKSNAPKIAAVLKELGFSFQKGGLCEV